MTKEEAIEQMKAGKKLRHTNFSNDEWVTSNASYTKLILEDGVQCTPQEFWFWRTDERWNTDWEFFKD
jgi:hypothetical protein